MRGAVIYAPGDIRLEDRADPTIERRSVGSDGCCDR